MYVLVKRASYQKAPLLNIQKIVKDVHAREYANAYRWALFKELGY